MKPSLLVPIPPVLALASGPPRSCYSSGTVLVSIQWVCDTCGASGETQAEMPCDNLADLTIEIAATTLLDGLRSVAHLHPVRPRLEQAS